MPPGFPRNGKRRHTTASCWRNFEKTRGGSLQKVLEKKIRELSQERIRDHERSVSLNHKYVARYKKRTGKTIPTPKVAKNKVHLFHKHFDPFYCRKYAKYLASVLVKKVQSGAYETKPAYRFYVPKKSAGVRGIDSFSIPDTALASLLSEALRTRNAKNFSSSSFAYQPGKTPLDAVLKVKGHVHAEKVFISQYDFENFYESIDIHFLEKYILETPRFHITSFEKKVIVATLHHKYIDTSGAMGERKSGIPQGSPLSLFLANAVGDFLDQALEKVNGNFVRFSDDSIVANYSYEDAVSCVGSYMNFSRDTGVKINKRKTEGISILSDQKGEMRTITEFDFLGYAISKNALRMSTDAISRIKSKVGQIIYHHLFMYPKNGKSISPLRLSGSHLDYDLVTCIWELRSYIYGGRSEVDIDRFLSGKMRIKNIGGPVSYFCLVQSVTQFSELDGWLLWALNRAVKERAKMIHDFGISGKWKGPDEASIFTGDWYDRPSFDGKYRDQKPMKPPSFVRAWRASRKCWSQHGLVGVIQDKNAYAYQGT